MRHTIISASARADFTVQLIFDDGEDVLVDLHDFIATGEVTEPLRQDPALFVEGLSIGGNGRWIAWPGDVDIDADALWYEAHPDELQRDYGPEAA